MLNVANFVSLKLNQTNYLYWETQIRALIERNGLNGFIDGTEASPKKKIILFSGEEVENLDYKAWFHID